MSRKGQRSVLHWDRHPLRSRALFIPYTVRIQICNGTLVLFVCCGVQCPRVSAKVHGKDETPAQSSVKVRALRTMVVEHGGPEQRCGRGLQSVQRGTRAARRVVWLLIRHFVLSSAMSMQQPIRVKGGEDGSAGYVERVELRMSVR